MENFLRRLITIPLVFVLAPLLVLLAPVVLVIGGLVDLIGGRRALPTFRLWLFATVFVIYECGVAVISGWLWVRGGFGRSLDIDRHRHIQGAWIGSLLGWARRLLNVSVQWPEPEVFPEGKVVILSRHASMIDAVIPGYLFPARLDRPVHYVLKRELRWLPSIDVFGHRLGNHFVDRNGDTEREVAAIVELYEKGADGAGIVIFPEGTYATPRTRARVLASLERKGDTELVDFARSLQYLLPPKPAGALALLLLADEVVIFGHVGLEGVAQFKGLRDHLPADRPVGTIAWTFHVADLPSDQESRTEWLHRQWSALDDWVVGQQRALETTNPKPRPPTTDEKLAG